MNGVFSNSQRKRALRNPKGQSSSKTAPGDDNKNCSFCLQVPAVISVQLPVLRHRNKRAATPYCLACYYTTAVVRYDPKHVQVLDEAQLQEQLPPMQQMFSEVYIELQKELSEEAALSFQKQQSDPLATLLVHRKSVTKPAKKKKTAGDAADGGFLRSIPLPDRLLQTQKQQAILHQAQMQRMNQAAAATTIGEVDSTRSTSHVYKRRKSSGKSIWNLAMDPTEKTKALEDALTSSEMIQANNEQYVSACSCGSKDVHNVGNMTSRNQDMRKGETWGMKDRGNDVVARYQCNSCGKTWNEEE